MAWGQNNQSKEAWLFETAVMNQYDRVNERAESCANGKPGERRQSLKSLGFSIRAFETSLNYYQNKSEYDSMVKEPKETLKLLKEQTLDESDEELYFECLMKIVDSIVYQFKYLGIRRPMYINQINPLKRTAIPAEIQPYEAKRVDEFEELDDDDDEIEEVE